MAKTEKRHGNGSNNLKLSI